MTASSSQGRSQGGLKESLSIDAMCRLARVSRAGYNRQRRHSALDYLLPLFLFFRARCADRSAASGWLGDQDSNLDKRSQSPLSYH
jgi:hypothetical protein